MVRAKTQKARKDAKDRKSRNKNTPAMKKTIVYAAISDILTWKPV